MAIIIQNVSELSEDGKGLHKYHVYINKQFICEFWHTREDGLAECLIKASKAVELQKIANIAKLLEIT